MTRLVVQKVILHLGEVTGLQCQAFNLNNLLLGVMTCCDDMLSQYVQRFAFVGHRWKQPLVRNVGQCLCVQYCQFTQC